MRINYDNGAPLSICFRGTSLNSHIYEAIILMRINYDINGAPLSEFFIGTDLNSEERQ